MIGMLADGIMYNYKECQKTNEKINPSNTRFCEAN